MPDNLKTKSILVYDNGLFVSWAEKLTAYFGKVFYYSPWKNAFPRFNTVIIGQDLPGVTRVKDFWDVFDEVDCYCFPDIYDGDLQVHLRALGKRVWGGGKGEELEIFRWETKEYLKEIGLPVQPVVDIQGLDALRKHLKTVENKWVKISQMRGDCETFHHDNYQLSEPRLAEMETKLGAAKGHAEFIVEDAIDDAVEAGYDGYCIDGKYPDIAMQGYEVKDAGLIGVIKEYNDFSKPVLTVNEKLSPAMKDYGYRGFFSTEVRVQKDGKPYLTDPCMRAGSPPNELYQEIFSNWGEIIWGGSNGELVQPIQTGKYGVEVMIHSPWADKNWQAVYFPEDVAPWVKLRNHTMIDDISYVAPQDVGLPEIGAVVAVADTLLEAIELVAKRAVEIKGYFIEIRMDSIVNGMAIIRKAEEMGIKFSDDPIPTVKEVADALGSEPDAG